ncbi:hypothetical protein [Herbaspirillum huttiense]
MADPIPLPATLQATPQLGSAQAQPEAVRPPAVRAPPPAPPGLAA